MKFCGTCGSQMDDNATVCPNPDCATNKVAPQSQVQQATQNVASKASQGVKAASARLNGLNKTGKICVYAGIAALVVILVALIVNIFNGYKKPIKTYFKAEKAEFKYAKAYYPPAVYKDENTKISYKIVGTEKLSKSKLEDLADDFNDTYNADYKFSAGKAVKVKVKYSGGEESETDYKCFIVVKKGLKWYIVSVRTIDKDTKLSTVVKNL